MSKFCKIVTIAVQTVACVNGLSILGEQTNASSFTCICVCVCCPEELASSEESGKDWSDLEREAAEADKERSDFQDEYAGSDKKVKGKRPGSYGGRKDSAQDRLASPIISERNALSFYM